MVHRVTVGWCNGGRCGGRMYYPKADYLEKVKAITSYFRKEMANMWWWNHNLCVRYVYLLKAGLNMEINRRMEILSCR